MPTDPSPSRSRRWPAGLGLFLLIVGAACLLAWPLWLIRPFAPQTPDGIAWAFALRRWAPLVTALAFVAGLALTVRLWRGGRWWSRGLAVLALAPLGAAAVFSRQNVFEKMFRPLETTGFVSADAATFVAEGDPVLAVTIEGESVAYPVRQVAYHHVVEDNVGGASVVVTY